MLDIINHQGNANQNCKEASPQTYQNGHHQKDKRYVSVRVWRKGNTRVLLVGMEIGAATVETSNGGSSTINTRATV